MKMLIKEFAELTGVTVRTLRYYDKIGLLKPSFIDQNNGYRFYDEKSLERMQEILFYRELDFSLKSISEILSYRNYNKQNIIKEQKYLLTLKKQRLEKIISALETIEQKGEIQMDVFDNKNFENAKNNFKDEVKERWRNTSAYKEYQA
ncbi:MAG: MerR family transcriptional regulator, partial [Clostridia bacterium]|nr:MerR family transcriptional regulator [Clostridia bacterium]